MNQIKTVFLSLLVIGFLASCTSDGSDVKDAARDAIANNTQANQVTPTATKTSQPTPAKAQVPTGPTTQLTYEETEWDFGTIEEGESTSHTYNFKNTGKEPLIISNAKGSCGCTVPKWPREPIAPGKSGEITVQFNSKGKKGQRTQKVTITANTNPPQSFLTLKGKVNPVGGAATKKPQINVN